jgi:putative transcriptional regulator
VHFGGPVDINRGFVLHSSDVLTEGSLVQEPGIALTANIAILREMTGGRGPEQSVLLLGYTGWAAGQLEAEIESSSWIVALATRELIFGTENDIKWNLAAASLGVDLTRLSGQVGHA